MVLLFPGPSLPWIVAAASLVFLAVLGALGAWAGNAPIARAVLRDPSSRGGSAAMHEQVREGDTLTIGAPKNHFALAHEAASHLLLAGGISGLSAQESAGGAPPPEVTVDAASPEALAAAATGGADAVEEWAAEEVEEAAAGRAAAARQVDSSLQCDGGEDREIDDLDNQVGLIDAEGAEKVDDIRDGVGGFGTGGGGLGGVGGEESGEEGHGEDFERSLGISAGKEKWRAPCGATPRDRLLREEDRVERDGFSKSHAQDGLDEDLGGSIRIATHGFDGLGANETHADSGSETAGSGREGTSDFSDDHVCCVFVFSSARRRGIPGKSRASKAKNQWACSSSWPASWLQMRPM